MADKFRRTAPVKITFADGELPTGQKLTAIGNQQRSSSYLLEKAIGDLWNQTGDSILSGYPLQIANLARMIGETKYLSPMFYPTLETFYYTENLGAKYEGKTTGHLLFKPSSTTISHDSGTAFFGPAVSNERDVNTGTEYWIDSDTGRFRTHTPISSVERITYQVTPGTDWIMQQEMLPCIIPDLSQADYYNLRVSESGGSYYIHLPPRRPITFESRYEPANYPPSADISYNEDATPLSGNKQLWQADGIDATPLAYYRYSLPKEIQDVWASLSGGDTLPAGFLYLWDEASNTVIEDVVFKVPSSKNAWILQVESNTFDFSTRTSLTEGQSSYESSQLRLIICGTSLTKTLWTLMAMFLRHNHDKGSSMEASISHNELDDQNPPTTSYTTDSHNTLYPTNMPPWDASNWANDPHTSLLSRVGSYGTGAVRTRDINDNAMLGPLVMANSQESSGSFLDASLTNDSFRIAFGHLDGPYIVGTSTGITSTANALTNAYGLKGIGNGNGDGLQGIAPGAGNGIWGQSQGVGYGLKGVNSGTGGGVYGSPSDTTGMAGIVGEAVSGGTNVTHGVKGVGMDDSGTPGYGGWFISGGGTNGVAIYAENTGSNGKTIYAITSGTNGTAIYGEGTGSQDTGVEGRSTASHGVVGMTNTSSTVIAGVYGGGFGTNSTGVIGAGAGTGSGVRGLGINGYGVYATSSGTHGVYAVTNEASSFSLYAYTTVGNAAYIETTVGLKVGLHAKSTTGNTIWGESSSTGTAVIGGSTNGYGGYFSGGNNGASSKAAFHISTQTSTPALSLVDGDIYMSSRSDHPLNVYKNSAWQRIFSSASEVLVIDNTDQAADFTAGHATSPVLQVTNDSANGPGVRIDSAADYALQCYVNYSSGEAAKFTNTGDNADRRGVRIDCGKYSPSVTGDVIPLMFHSGDTSTLGQVRYNSTGPSFEFNWLSDRRLKTNIAPTQVSGLEIIGSLPLFEFNRIDLENHPFIRIGYIADECEKVYPSMVHTDTKTGYKMVGDGSLIPLLVKSIQELKKELDELKTKQGQ